MPHYQRILQLPSLLSRKSFFLFGPRSTGKTALVRKQFPGAKIFDLLDDDQLTELTRRPKSLSEKLSKGDSLVIIDEIQKVPELLNEVHRLIEEKKIRFLLTGSSARKLRRKGVNLLGGRAWEAHLFPLTSAEIPNFSLSQYLNRGGLPHIYPSTDYQEELKSYISLYIRDEIKAEALVRNLGPFVRFLDTLALANGEELHYENLSNDSAVPARTIENYLHILEETYLGFQVLPFLQSKKRKAISRSKFFFFDVGVVNRLAKRGEIVEGSELFGSAFEHFMMMEVRAYLSYRRRDEPLQYWRTTSQVEVDCIVGNQIALEFKGSKRVTEKHLKGLLKLQEEQLVKKLAVVSLDPERKKIGSIVIYPWREFLDLLWKDEILPR